MLAVLSVNQAPNHPEVRLSNPASTSNVMAASLRREPIWNYGLKLQE